MYEEKHVSDERGIRLGLTDIGGVFIIVCVAAGISFIVLLVELFVASFLSTIEDNPGAPRMI